jgi:hypothetical protein
MTLSWRPTCEHCGRACALGASDGGHKVYFCANTTCSHFGKRISGSADPVGSGDPERKESK